MSNIINLNLGTNVLTFNFGAFNLDYHTNDEKEDTLQIKSEELMEKATELEKNEKDMSFVESKEAIKHLIDDFFEVAFDADAPQKIYEVAGKSTWNYLNIFMQVSTKIKKDRDQKLNDENFKKFLAE